MTSPVKDCFGTVIASLKKMKECVRCELLVECRSMNWQEGAPGGEDGPETSRIAASGGRRGRDPVSGGAAGA